jgi:hypothetical protein
LYALHPLRKKKGTQEKPPTPYKEAQKKEKGKKNVLDYVR